MRTGFFPVGLAAAIAVLLPGPACKPTRPAITHVQGAVTSKEPDQRVVARIGDREITVQELRKRLDAMPVYVRMRYRSAERRREFLESYVEFEVLALEAQRLGYASDPEVVGALKSAAVERFLKEKVDSRVHRDQITEQMVRDWYETHLELYHRPAQFRVSHILLDDPVLAGKVHFRAVKLCGQPGADPREEFTKLVKEYSKDKATLNTGGDIGFFPRKGNGAGHVPSKVSAEVADVAGKMRSIFEVSDVVKDADGYHILFASSRRPSVDKSLDQARAEIVPLLMERKREDQRKEFVNRLMKKARVRIHEDAV
ncbi:MAG: hypothetical protein GXP54_01370, partial [Deltaproteobacteria bacterium]|nr:hypothetical protein [Deltaproteobacteria bacterium]